MKRSYLFFLLTIISLTVQAQDISNNRLSTSVIAYANIHETINWEAEDHLIPLQSIYFQRRLKDYLWLLGGYGHRDLMVADECKKCFDAAMGEGYFKEDIFQAGIAAERPVFKSKSLHLYLAVNLMYSSSAYSGRFVDGWTGSYELDDRFNKYGSSGQLGLAYIYQGRLVLTVLTGLLGEEVHRTSANESDRDYFYLGPQPFELRLGVNF